MDILYGHKVNKKIKRQARNPTTFQQWEKNSSW